MKKIGMRTIKTGIAVFLALLAGYFGVVQTPVYTVSVCIFSIKNTLKNTLDDARIRILGTLLGGLIGFLFAIFTSENIFEITLGVILVIHLCNIFNISDSAAIASVTFTSISIGLGKNQPLIYSIERTLDTLVGLLIALIINYSFYRPKFLKYLLCSFNSSYKDYLAIVSNMFISNDYSSSYIKLLSKFQDVHDFYNQLIDDLPLSNESHKLTSIHDSYDICEQLLHHVQGLYLIEKRISSMETLANPAIYKYHKDSISRLLHENKNQK